MNQNGTVVDVSHLSANQVRALDALLKTTSISEASKECGLSLTTVKRYLADEMFATVYRKQRMLILQQTVAGLTNLSSKAIAKLGAAMDAGEVNTELRAASRVLDYLAKLFELERRIREQDDHEERLTRLESDEQANGNGGYLQW